MKLSLKVLQPKLPLTHSNFFEQKSRITVILQKVHNNKNNTNFFANTEPHNKFNTTASSTNPQIGQPVHA